MNLWFSSYFKPVKYQKYYSSSDQFPTSSFGWFVSKLIACLALSFGTIILLNQFIIPWFFYKGDRDFFPSVPSSFHPSYSSNTSIQAQDNVLGASGTASATEPFFELYIPKLSIYRATVEVNAQSLVPDKYLGHYPGSALPGKPGNTFVFGHSALRAFYQPKKYKTIFSTLSDLVTGDYIYLDYQDNMYIYQVENSLVLAPEQVNPYDTIAPASLGRSYLTLMTCIPPGLDTKRLLVIARLVGID
ncbi:hypothetical protein COT52_00635 [candidate division WWE3 bacterium CG08_land_8_20_14_0_20_43_13]|uniref:Sortase n=1 Tax=candidate division WWE3 bacterium CG08_land_8_20_14_0_20_43_13 TaxID=1975087 RepID=A0A2H0X808_UNCKA|nr:MAG: hypothetical protein COT52_00635 [candidate division WWE3 bacterium CG08_land_8_20_14_0_20_43_13]